MPHTGFEKDHVTFCDWIIHPIAFEWHQNKTMKQGLFLAALATLPLGAADHLPTLKGEFLSGRPAVLPDAASGKVALLALGFTYQSRFAVEAWIARFRKDFGGNREITFFEIPMIGGMARMGKWFIDSGMRRGTPKADQENVITVYGGVDPWKQRVGYQAPDAAYLILLDRSGIIRWQHAGVFDEAAYGDLASRIRELSGNK